MDNDKVSVDKYKENQSTGSEHKGYLHSLCFIQTSQIWLSISVGLQIFRRVDGRK